MLVRLAWSPEFEEYATADLPRLMRIARVLTGNDHDAADLVQDCLAKMGRRWSDGKPISNPHAYARATLVNLNVSRLRKVKRELLVRSVPESGPSDGGHSAELDPWLESALAALPVRQRAAVALAYLEDLPVDEIAKALGCAISTAKTHLARGRDALRRAADAEQPSHDSTTPVAKEGRPSWDDGLRNAVRDLVADTHPPTDLLDRALTQAVCRRRWLVGLGAAAASAALVGGSFAGAIALERSPSHGGVRPAGDATSTIGLDEIPADLTGKALADAMGLQVVMNCGASMQVAKNPYLTLCLPDNWEWESVEGQEILLQLRGYERTDAMRAFAEQEAIANQYGLNPDREPGSWAEIAERLEQLRAQLYAEQGERPETGFENYDPTASPTTD